MKPRRFVVHYLNGNLRTMARDGRSLPVAAKDHADAVVRVFGAPADPESWCGERCTKWGGTTRLRIEEIQP